MWTSSGRNGKAKSTLMILAQHRAMRISNPNDFL